MSQDNSSDPGKGIGGAVAVVFEFLERHLSPLVPSVVKSWASRPTIVEDARRSRPWHLAKQSDGRYLMQINHEWLITNNADAPLRIIRAEINRRGAEGGFLIEGDGGFTGDYAIPPKATVRMDTQFMCPASKRQWPRPKWFDYTFTDHTGYRTRVRGVEAKPPRRARKTTKLHVEAMANIADEDERAVASILKEELNRYAHNDREHGGLGTVKAQIGNQKRDHIYQDSWTSSRRGERQDIAGVDSRLVSENGDALVAYYQSVDAERQARIVQFLKDRIDRDREYFGVSYLIVYVLWRVGKLSEALEAVRSKYEYKPSIHDRLFRRSYINRVLEKAQRHGYSDVFGFLNGLLRYEHAGLSEDDLHAIERFVSGASEYPFQIVQKIASVRAYRIAGK